MVAQRVPSPSRYAPVIGFSCAVRVGDLVFVSGTTAVDAAGDVVGGDDPYAQTVEVLRKIGVALTAAGSSVAHNAADDARLAIISQRIDASSGTLVKRAFSGGSLDGPRTLTIVTLRAGSDDAVSADALSAVEAGGYPRQANRGPCTTQTRSCLVMTPGLPSVGVETFPSGSAVRGLGVTVPAGETGVVYSITARSD